ncbi:hypothetical protein Aab01nite_50560 [Paractinoplanes abujensis]|uniref:Integral membrane protein n=1 Tax=Paractinoplanes abujensis TaxID=882441 RepID=A0A7W7CVQ8_9ACTN|nr:hypothetical protein [Actinoplanes abujensis]MBB4693876.1 hypothetical protein [Actinoplanes abujensis]GID21466.1 hypothetical protein Aab01nite_50560 [Actinoplanes abujensis]
MDPHLAFVTAHALAAAVALVSALLAVRRPRFAGIHAVSTIAMTVFLIPAVWLGDASGMTLIVFLGLLVLAAVMSFRAVTARRLGGGGAYVEALGFNAISLVTGLVAVSVFRLGWGLPLLIPVAVGAIALPALIGRRLITRAKAATPSGAPTRNAAAARRHDRLAAKDV